MLLTTFSLGAPRSRGAVPAAAVTEIQTIAFVK